MATGLSAPSSRFVVACLVGAGAVLRRDGGATHDADGDDAMGQ